MFLSTSPVERTVKMLAMSLKKNVRNACFTNVILPEPK